MTVLIVEPSRVQAGIIRKYLEAQEWFVAKVVATGQQALDAIRANRPDAIVAALASRRYFGGRTRPANSDRVPTAGSRVSCWFPVKQRKVLVAGKLNRVLTLRKPFKRNNGSIFERGDGLVAAPDSEAEPSALGRRAGRVPAPTQPNAVSRAHC